MFGTFMTVILIGYACYYCYNIIHDLYFKKSMEVIATPQVEESDIDIKDELQDFTRYDAKTELEDDNAPTGTGGNKNENSITMSGGMTVDQLQKFVSSLEGQEVNSEFDIVCQAMNTSFA